MGAAGARLCRFAPRAKKLMLLGGNQPPGPDFVTPANSKQTARLGKPHSEIDDRTVFG
jgi:hypothetical protein